MPAWFAADPAGWLSLLIAVMLILFSAVFWRRLWGVLKSAGPAAAWVWHKLPFEIRSKSGSIATTIEASSPARFSVQPVARTPSDGYGFVVMKLNSGTASNLKIRSATADLVIGAEDSWPGAFQRVQLFEVLTVPMFGLADQLRFDLTWTDEGGAPRSQQCSVRMSWGRPAQDDWFAKTWGMANGEG
jgi:hypothetical protein